MAGVRSSGVLLDGADQAAEWIDRRQGASGIYYHVGALRADLRDAKATKRDIRSALHLHVDVDVCDDATLEKIRSFIPSPTLIVFSGGGYQPIWRLREPSTELDRVERINMAIAQALGGDKCHNVDRLLRLPGTINMPNAKKRAAGRVPTLARIVEMDWNRVYSLDEFPCGETDASNAATMAADMQPAEVRPTTLEELPPGVDTATRDLILKGDDPDRPRGSASARFPSRSEGVFRVACELARAGCSDEAIAGVFINREYEISRSILEKRSPARYALKQAKAGRAAVESGWPDPDRHGSPRATLRNTVVALQRLGLSFSFDLFRYRKLVNGSVLDEFQGEISDDACAMLRSLVIEQFGFDPRAENVRDAANQLCLENAFHPIRQELDALVWDGVPRPGQVDDRTTSARKIRPLNERDRHHHARRGRQKCARAWRKVRPDCRAGGQAGIGQSRRHFRSLPALAITPTTRS